MTHTREEKDIVFNKYFQAVYPDYKNPLLDIPSAIDDGEEAVIKHFTDGLISKGYVPLNPSVKPYTIYLGVMAGCYAAYVGKKKAKSIGVMYEKYDSVKLNK